MTIDDLSNLYRTYMQACRYRNTVLLSEADLMEKILELKPGEMLSVEVIDGGDTDV